MADQASSDWMGDAEPLMLFSGIATFAAANAAERFCERAGFSVGSSCAMSPQAIMFGDYLVAKWKNLSHRERAECHGRITGDRRTGPVMISLTPACPPEGRAAFLAEASDTVS